MWRSPLRAYLVSARSTVGVSILPPCAARRAFTGAVLGSRSMGRAGDHSISRALARADAAKSLSVDDLEALLACRGERLEELMAIASRLRDIGHGHTVTYSRKVFIPLTMLCRDHCHYCTLAN